MKPARMFGVVLVAVGVLAAQQAPQDPVMKARAERARAQGIQEQDLPPVPRAILEPPPLPPPETHVRDLKGSAKTRMARVSRGARRKGASKSLKVKPSNPKKKISRTKR